MLSEESVSRKSVAGFLLGLGIGLVVGIVFQPQTDDTPQRLGAAKAVPRKLPRESDERVAKP